MVTPDGRYFFFSRRIGGGWDVVTECEIYWKGARVLERFGHRGALAGRAR